MTTKPVPREPTPEMIEAAFGCGFVLAAPNSYAEIWRAMWDAAPAEPAREPSADDADERLIEKLRHGDHDYQETTIHAWMNEAADRLAALRGQIAGDKNAAIDAALAQDAAGREGGK